MIPLLPKAQNPTFAPYLHTLFSVLESYSLFLWSFLLPVIAGLRPHNLCFANKQYYIFQINLNFPPLAGTGRESIVLETVVLLRDLFVPFACAAHPNQGTYVSPPHVTTLYGTWGGGYLRQPSPRNYFVWYVGRCRRHPTE